MPTHGYGKFRGMPLGSVTAKVLHDAKCDIWTSAHTEDLAPPRHAEYTNILCAVDLAPENVRLIRYATDLALRSSAKLRLVHAITGAGTGRENWANEKFRQFLFQFSREEIAKLQREAGTDLEVCIDGGDVATVLREAATHHDADLAIIGRGKLPHAFGRLRTNAYAIIRDSPCPVLSV